MAVVSIKSFGGISPRTPARYLQDNQAQTALNAAPFAGSLAPLANVGSSLLTLPKDGVPRTIYRFGQDAVSDTKYWFHWPFPVDVCRSQIHGDESEWTFFTGDGAPKATYNKIALSSANYPAASIPLGLPVPLEPLTTSFDVFDPDTIPATVTLTPVHISQLKTAFGINYSLDNGVIYLNIPLASTTPAAVAAALDGVAQLNAVVVDGGVEVSTVATGSSATLNISYKVGTEPNQGGAFTATGPVDIQATSTSTAPPFLPISDIELDSVEIGDELLIYAEDGLHVPGGGYVLVIPPTTADWVIALNHSFQGALTATAYGSSIALTPGTSATGTDGFILYRRFRGGVLISEFRSDYSPSPRSAFFIVDQTAVSAVADSIISITYQGIYLGTIQRFLYISPAATPASLLALQDFGLTVIIFGNRDPVALISAPPGDPDTVNSLTIESGVFPTVDDVVILSDAGGADESEILDTRVYTYTWVNKVGGYDFESAPAPASDAVDVRFKQVVNLSNFMSPPQGYSVTHRRVYRSVSGIFLFVDEIPISASKYEDDSLPDELSEELPSLTWTPPPATLQGLVNLPNGILAGFTGRDIYFSVPYRPHAWPIQYIQSVDFPVVGLGKIDTTLIVLTTGTPYFIQGTGPESMVVVRSNLEQACVSKKSIVSFNGIVVYASPDGLIALAPGDSKILTDTIYDRAQWQSFRPESIHAYQTDLKYVGFYDTGIVQGGFIYDFKSGQFITHNIYATAGYTDIQQDKLFLAFSDKALKIWNAGSALSYTWKSKKFTMVYPLSFNCAQVEAESYSFTAKFYAGGSLVHTQTVANRNPFRLPAVTARDWEIQIEGATEIFSIDLAQSVAELGNV